MLHAAEAQAYPCAADPYLAFNLPLAWAALRVPHVAETQAWSMQIHGHDFSCAAVIPCAEAQTWSHANTRPCLWLRSSRTLLLKHRHVLVQIHGHDFSCAAIIPCADEPGGFRYASGSEEKMIRVLEAPQAFLDTLHLAGLQSSLPAPASAQVLCQWLCPKSSWTRADG